MISKKEIEDNITVLLEYLASVQTLKGSFKRMKIQPYSSNPTSWSFHTDESSYDTAVSLIPLCFLKDNISQNILKKGVQHLLNKSERNFIWTWPGNHPIPFCTDDTSVSSFVLEQNGFKIKNKRFLDLQINQKGQYNFFIWNFKYNRSIPLPVFFKAKIRNLRVKKSDHYLLNEINVSDSEFTNTCINLLYTNKSEENEKAWKQIKKQFIEDDFDFIYYLNDFYAVYHYLRLYGYGNHADLLNDKIAFETKIQSLEKEISSETDTIYPKKIMLINSILFSDLNIHKYQHLIFSALKDIEEEKYKENTVCYSSHLATEKRPKEERFFTLYGSSAYNTSLYIEFLNLLHYKLHNNYFSL